MDEIIKELSFNSSENTTYAKLMAMLANGVLIPLSIMGTIVIGELLIKTLLAILSVGTALAFFASLYLWDQFFLWCIQKSWMDENPLD